MRLHRFSGSFDFSQRVVHAHDKKLCNQLKNVLRLNVHDQVILSNMDRKEAHALITGLTPTTASFEILDVYDNPHEPNVSVTLYCSLLKKENFEWVAQKATEIGIKELVPLIASRTIKTGFSPERISAIITEAAEQAGRGIVPTLGSAHIFSDAFSQALKEGDVFVCDREGEALEKAPGYKKSCSIFIGPEGGWDDRELEMVKNADAHIISLGNLTLRAETAAIVASYCAVYYLSKKHRSLF
ncbi:MAG: 16S rRNA (uracil(1498)-N(3))-methyltransferase [Candidatus Pacebacteria bacterium]|nr:16S rRNA (uracil(1498)-N(3))-methyltransferase [Candidatus Paceibacterota bacterium]